MSQQPTDREGKAQGHTPSMHTFEESDHVVVPVNPSNKSDPSLTELGEGSAWTKENVSPSSTHPTQSGVRVFQGLAGVRQARFDATHPR